MTNKKKPKTSPEFIVREIKRKTRRKYSPAELGARISEWVDHYNNYRYHEAIDDVAPSNHSLAEAKKSWNKGKERKLRPCVRGGKYIAYL